MALLAVLLAAAYLFRRSSVPRVSESANIELVAGVDLGGRATAGPTWNPDGSMLATATEGGQVLIVTADGEIARTLNHGVAPTSLSWSPEGSHLATASWGQMKVWRVADGAQVARMVSGEVYEVKGWVGEGQVVTWNGEESFASWDRDSGRLVDKEFISIGQQQMVPSPDGKLATWQSGAGGVYTVFSVDSDGHDEWPLRGHEGPVAQVAWSPDSAELAGATDSGVVVWNAADGELDRVLWTPSAAVRDIEWNATGSLLLVLTEDGYATVIDAADGTEMGASVADATLGAVWARDGWHFAVVSRPVENRPDQSDDSLLILRVAEASE
jgi:WD40 repeat protein